MRRSRWIPSPGVGARQSGEGQEPMASGSLPPPPPLSPVAPSAPQCFSGLESVPADLVLLVAAVLRVCDLCSLGSCSRYWHQLCSSDSLWASLCARRWLLPSLPPSRSLAAEGESAAAFPSDRGPTFPFSPPEQGWKGFYVKCHQEMASRVSKVIKLVKQCSQDGSLEVGDFLKAVAALHALDVGYVDIQFFLWKLGHNVLLNLIGLHYVIFYLRVPEDEVTEALQASRISGRQVCVNWFKLGRWFYGFRLPDESRFRKVSLLELATSEKEVRNILNRGAIYEVLRVQITTGTSSTSEDGPRAHTHATAGNRV